MIYKNSHSKATTEYNKRSTVSFTIRLNIKTDSDILDALESVDNRNALVKKLLRDAIAAENNRNESRSFWLDNWVEDSNDDDGGHYNGLICSCCKQKGTARPFYQVTAFCPDCGNPMFKDSKRTKKN